MTTDLELDARGRYVSPHALPSPCERELLTILIEECGEIIQAATKSLRFGAEDGYPGTDRTNRDDLSREIGDLFAMSDMLAGMLNGALIAERRASKPEKVLRFLQAEPEPAIRAYLANAKAGAVAWEWRRKAGGEWIDWSPCWDAHHGRPNPFYWRSLAAESPNLIQVRPLFTAPRDVGELVRAASEYLGAVRQLGQQSGFKRLTYFEAPISQMPTPEMVAEATRRWLQLNDTGRALHAALSSFRSQEK